jgi:hypothetical protein
MGFDNVCGTNPKNIGFYCDSFNRDGAVIGNDRRNNPDLLFRRFTLFDNRFTDRAEDSRTLTLLFA